VEDRVRVPALSAMPASTNAVPVQNHGSSRSPNSAAAATPTIGY
jgi:hypothetical protein